jgi:uncharacterized protein YdhG (YjbR/CyaY superfamily)
MCAIATLKRVFKTIDEFIATFPKNIQSVLQELRETIRESVPKAEEVISYQMHAFKLNGVLAWFAATGSNPSGCHDKLLLLSVI